jgi:hypothetical protein
MDDFVLESITSEDQLLQVIAQLETQMREAAKKFEFERAAQFRDRIRALKQKDLGALFGPVPLPPPTATAEQPLAAPATEGSQTVPGPTASKKRRRVADKSKRA